MDIVVQEFDMFIYMVVHQCFFKSALIGFFALLKKLPQSKKRKYNLELVTCKAKGIDLCLLIHQTR